MTTTPGHDAVTDDQHRRHLPDGARVVPRGWYRYDRNREPRLTWQLDGEARRALHVDARRNERTAVAAAFLAHATSHPPDPEVVTAAIEILFDPDDDTWELDSDGAAFVCESELGVDFTPDETGTLPPLVHLVDATGHTNDRRDAERYTVSFDGWDLLVVDIEPWGTSDQARIGVADLDCRRELAFDDDIALTEHLLLDTVRPVGDRVTVVEHPIVGWHVCVDDRPVVHLARDDDPARVLVAVLDENENQPAVRFDASVRYRQLPVARPIDARQRLRQLSETVRSIPPLGTGRIPW